jgi:hypothetical protein
MEYYRKIDTEQRTISDMEHYITNMETLESDLLSKLQNTQHLEHKAVGELESAIKDAAKASKKRIKKKSPYRD